MHAFPHHYTATAAAHQDTANVTVSATGLSDISTNAPAEFGGPGDQWSPEGLIMAAVADCFVLSFRAIATASKIDWQSIHCQAVGTLDQVDRKMVFTAVELDVTVTASADANPERLERLLHKAEETCLITNSLTAGVTLNTQVQLG